MMLLWLTVGLGIPALLFSLFFGCKACEIFSVPKPEKKSGRFYLFWFNFFGSVVGWQALWLVMFKIFRCIEGLCQAEIGFGDLVLGLIALAGITGHLPLATMGIFQSLGDRAKGLLAKWFS